MIPPAAGGPRFARLRAEVRDDRRALEKRLAELRGLPINVPWDAGACAIAAIALHAGYGAVEAALERITRAIDGEPTNSPNWHRELLHGATLELDGIRPAILSHETAAALRQVLGFRHFFRHAYAADLDATQLQPLASRLLAVAPSLAAELDLFDAYLRDADSVA